MVICTQKNGVGHALVLYMDNPLLISASPQESINQARQELFPASA